MQKTLVGSTGCALFLAASLAAAQTQTSDKATDAAKDVTVTGCLAQGADTSHYILMKASAAGAGAAAQATATSGIASQAGPAPNTTYELSGGGDLKPHLGHKVEVTGSPIAPDMKKDLSTSKEPAPRSAMGTGGSEIHGAMNVKSVKMLASNCS